ncbi:membrane protein, putative [Oceaniovalibus guishaninsula JLT2003]|uniref:UPF0056 membrane protein n=1 Tax=Oceaniovalibus guishaninsula JLT2003 TaxID=1231392 RepID=K2HT70_9RHOB|nr:MarC family protein [Oceaniovalibus guishaninsula]EKE45824.1 membrane protein, putative [Oceaniovalibus guishaninsula JLT2003]
MPVEFFLTAFVTLFVVIDPIGLTPVFVALTKGMDPRHRAGIALRACLTGAIILVTFGILGEQVLTFIGISMPAFRIAGGILLFLTALDMLFERRSQRRRGRADGPTDDPSVFPLAIPLIAGPGAIATMILLTDQTAGHLTALAAVLAVMLVIVGGCYVLFRVADPIERALGDTGIVVVTRLLGMLLAALSVQFVLDGLAGFGIGAALP